jgi:hypothetical protein
MTITITTITPPTTTITPGTIGFQLADVLKDVPAKKGGRRK